jgi:hypothetical protein
MRILMLTLTIALALAGCLARSWTEHAYPAWGFAAAFPAPPIEADTSTATVRSFALTGSGEDKTLAVGVIDLTGVTKPDEQVMSEAIAAIAGDRPVTVAYWALGPAGAQHMGRAAVIDRGGGLKMTLHVLVANGRLYQVSAVSLGAKSPKTEKFLGSFRIIEPAP